MFRENCETLQFHILLIFNQYFFYLINLNLDRIYPLMDKDGMWFEVAVDYLILVTVGQAML